MLVLVLVILTPLILLFVFVLEKEKTDKNQHEVSAYSFSFCYFKIAFISTKNEHEYTTNKQKVNNTEQKLKVNTLAVLYGNKPKIPTEKSFVTMQ